MTEYNGALLTGQISRSNHTVQVHRSVRDGYANHEDFQKAIEEDRREILTQQIGFAYATGGQADWLDLLRPIASTFQGFIKRGSTGEDAVGPVTRWYRTNTFYRKPLIASKIDSKGSELTTQLPQLEQKGVLFLIGPYSFTRLVENKYYNTPRELGLDYSKALSKNIAELKNKNYRQVLLIEQAVGYELSKKSFEKPSWYKEAIHELKKNCENLGIHYPLADALETVPLAENTEADFVGVDCIYTAKPEQITTKKALLLGIIDGARAGIENPNEIATQVKHITSNAHFSGKYYIAPNNRLYDVPFEIALQKIELLTKIGEELQ